jgi:hypothetical protein
VLFETERSEGEKTLDDVENFKVLLLAWVVTEVLDANWSPPRDFAGEPAYAYHRIEPSRPAPAPDAAGA